MIIAITVEACNLSSKSKEDDYKNEKKKDNYISFDRQNALKPDDIEDLNASQKLHDIATQLSLGKVSDEFKAF